MTRFVYYSRDLRFFASDEAHVVDGRCCIADRLTQGDEDGPRVYVRLTSYRWGILRDLYAPDVLAPIRQALVDLYGEARVAASENNRARVAA